MTEPTLLRIQEVKLVNTNKEEEDIKKIDYEGQDLLETDEVKSHTNNGYVMRGFKAKVEYKNENVEVSVNTSNTMSYAKVEKAGNYAKADELIAILRDKYLAHFRQ
jgi:hypothetical protein